MSSHGGTKKGLFNNSAQAQGEAGLYGTEAQNELGVLQPQLQQDIINPTGYTPTQMGQMQTAAMQSAGGSNAGVAGGALQRAARTRNAGAGNAVASEAGNQAAQRLSQINAGIQSRSADLAQQKRSSALKAEEGLYGTNVGAGEGALGLSNQALNDAGNLSNFWQQLMLQGLQSAGDVAAAAAGKS
jgi:hypothetical protein